VSNGWASIGQAFSLQKADGRARVGVQIPPRQEVEARKWVYSAWREARGKPGSGRPHDGGRSRGILVHHGTACQSEKSQPVAADPARPASEMSTTGVGG